MAMRALRRTRFRTCRKINNNLGRTVQFIWYCDIVARIGRKEQTAEGARSAPFCVVKTMARPSKDINQKQFEELCKMQCTKEEIAGVFDCSEDTIERWCNKTYGESFAVVFGKKRMGGKASLRRAQWNLAQKNATMAIWLGKQWLGQRDEDVRASAQATNGVLEALYRLEHGTEHKAE